MSTKLKNRRETEGKLGSFIEHLSISEAMVHSILDAEVGGRMGCACGAHEMHGCLGAGGMLEVHMSGCIGAVHGVWGTSYMGRRVGVPSGHKGANCE